MARKTAQEKNAEYNAADAIENVLKETRRFLAGARAQGNLFARKTA